MGFYSDKIGDALAATAIQASGVWKQDTYHVVDLC